MDEWRMVPVTRVHQAFEARVLVAQLGSEGIVAQLRGAVDGPYPVGDVEVLVDERDLPVAREILAVTAPPGPLDDPGPIERRGRRPPIVPLLIVAALVASSVLGALRLVQVGLNG